MPSERTASDIVDAQLNAYNRRDLEAFCSFYADDVTIYDHPNTIRFRGKEALRRTYAERFAQSPDLHATIGTRICHAEYVIDHETVRGFMGEREITVVATYRVHNGTIAEVWFLQ